MSNNDYILFYSNKCMHSKEFLVLLSKDSSLDRKFIKVNVDNRGVKIPPYVKKVPSAIIPMNGSPNLLVGVNIFKWYNDNHQKSSQGGQGQRSNQILDYDPFGMAGYSDTFSFLDDKSEPLKKAFSFLNENFTISSPEEGSFTDNRGNNDDSGRSGGGRESLKKTQLDSDYERKMNQRKLEVPMGQPRIG